MATKDIFAVLKECELFEGLADNELEWISTQLKKRDLAEKECLFEQGDQSRGAHIILEGELGVRSHILEEKGNEIPFTPIIAKFTKGEVIGEFALLDSRPRSAEVFAILPSVVLTFEQKTLEELAEVHPLVGYRVMRNLARIIVKRMRHTNEQFAGALQWNWKQAGFDKV